jgi:hypothetical protein
VSGSLRSFPAPAPSERYLTRVELAEGGRVQQTKNGIMIFPADKTKPAVTLHRTPSDVRAIKNAISQLRRSGFNV